MNEDIMKMVDFVEELITKIETDATTKMKAIPSYHNALIELYALRRVLIELAEKN